MEKKTDTIEELIQAQDIAAKECCVNCHYDKMELCYPGSDVMDYGKCSKYREAMKNALKRMKTADQY